MQSSGQSNDFSRFEDLQSLSEMRSEQGTVFSLYLDLRRGNLLDRFEQLLRQMEQQKKPGPAAPADREPWDQNVEQLRGWLNKEPPLEGQGLAVFSSAADGLWRVFLLPAPVFDRLVTGDRPYVRPLEIMANEFKCTLVVLIDASAARIVEVSLGQAQEIDRVEAVPVTGGAPGDGVNPHVHAVIERAQEAWQARGCDRLVIGGGGDVLLDELREALPESLRKHLAGEIRVSAQAELEQILAQARQVEREQERQLEAQRVEELITSAGKGGSVLGPDQTLLAIKEKRVRLLVVEEDYHQAGGECPNCGLLSVGEQQFCLLDEMALRPEADVIEVALKRVLDQGGEIDVLRSAESRSALEPHGRIGALVRIPAGALPNKDISNQLPLEKEGKLNKDVQHDETIEESFPASDPPGSA